MRRLLAGVRPAAGVLVLGVVLVLVAGTFDAEALYVPGVAFVAARRRLAVAWVAARRARRAGHAHARRPARRRGRAARRGRRGRRRPAARCRAASSSTRCSPTPRPLGFGPRAAADADPRALRPPRPPHARAAGASSSATRSAWRRVTVAGDHERRGARAAARSRRSGRCAAATPAARGRRGRPAMAAEVELDGVREHRAGHAGVADLLAGARARRGADGAPPARRVRLAPDDRARRARRRARGGPRRRRARRRLARGRAGRATAAARSCCPATAGRPRSTTRSAAGRTCTRASRSSRAAAGASLSGIASRLGPVIYVAPHVPSRPPRALEHAPAAGRVIVVPGRDAGPPARRSRVAGCMGYDLEPGRAAEGSGGVSATALRPTPAGRSPPPAPAAAPPAERAPRGGRAARPRAVDPPRRVRRAGGLRRAGVGRDGPARGAGPRRVGARSPAPALGALALLDAAADRGRCAPPRSPRSRVAGVARRDPARRRARCSCSTPSRWGDLTSGLGQGISALPGLSVPYRGVDEWNRIAMLLGGTALAIAGPLLAGWPGRARPAHRAVRPGDRARRPLRGARGAAARRPPVPRRHGLRAAARRGALRRAARAPRRAASPARRSRSPRSPAWRSRRGSTSRDPWLDYESIAQSLGERGTTAFTWNHRYGPLDWPRDGREVLRIRARRGVVLEGDDARRLRRPALARGPRRAGIEDDPEADRPNPRWVAGAARARPQHAHAAVRLGRARRCGSSARRGPSCAGAPGSYVTERAPAAPRPRVPRARVRAAADARAARRRVVRLPGDDRAVPVDAAADPRRRADADRPGDDDAVAAARRRRSCSSRRAATPDRAPGRLRQPRRGRPRGARRAWLDALALRAHVAARAAAARRSRRRRTTTCAACRPTCATASPTPRRRRARAVPLDGFLFDDKRGYCQQFSGRDGAAAADGRRARRASRPASRRARSTTTRASTSCATSTRTRGSRRTSRATAG